MDFNGESNRISVKYHFNDTSGISVDDTISKTFDKALSVIIPSKSCHGIKLKKLPLNKKFRIQKDSNI